MFRSNLRSLEKDEMFNWETKIKNNSRIISCNVYWRVVSDMNVKWVLAFKTCYKTRLYYEIILLKYPKKYTNLNYWTSFMLIVLTWIQM